MAHFAAVVVAVDVASDDPNLNKECNFLRLCFFLMFFNPKSNGYFNLIILKIAYVAPKFNHGLRFFGLFHWLRNRRMMSLPTLTRRHLLAFLAPCIPPTIAATLLDRPLTFHMRLLLLLLLNGGRKLVCVSPGTDAIIATGVVVIVVASWHGICSDWWQFAPT